MVCRENLPFGNMEDMVMGVKNYSIVAVKHKDVVGQNNGAAIAVSVATLPTPLLYIQAE